jgi:hypothetical protein
MMKARAIQRVIMSRWPIVDQKGVLQVPTPGFVARSSRAITPPPLQSHSDSTARHTGHLGSRASRVNPTARERAARTAPNRQAPHMMWPHGVRVASLGEEKHMGHVYLANAVPRCMVSGGLIWCSGDNPVRGRFESFGGTMSISRCRF